MALSSKIVVSMETGRKGQFWGQRNRFPNFIRNCSLLFSETFHDIKLTQEIETDMALFSGKILISMETASGSFSGQKEAFSEF